MEKARLKLAMWIAFITLAVLVAAYLVPLMWRTIAPVQKESPVQITYSAPATAPTTNSTNAADSYREAMKLDNDLEASPELANQYLRYQEGKFDSDAAKFFADHIAIAQFVRNGTGARVCDWGDIDPYSILNDIRRIGNYTIANARWAIQQHDPATAVNDSLAVMALARHTGKTPRMLIKLIEVGVTTQGINAMAAALPSLTPEQLKAANGRLDALPKSASWGDVLMGDYEQGRKDVRERGGNFVVVAMADSLEPFYREIGKGGDQPPTQFDQTVDAAAAKFKANAAAQQLAAATKARHNTLIIGQTRFAMLQAAITILLEGPDAVAKSREPFAQGPFIYAKTTSGFDLASHLQDRGKPVILSVGGQ